MNIAIYIILYKRQDGRPADRPGPAADWPFVLKDAWPAGRLKSVKWLEKMNRRLTSCNEIAITAN